MKMGEAVSEYIVSYVRKRKKINEKKFSNKL